MGCIIVIGYKKIMRLSVRWLKLLFVIALNLAIWGCNGTDGAGGEILDPLG